MSIIIQPKDLADLLRFEAESRYSRERVTLAAGHNLTLGTVVATDTATGKIAPLDPSDTGSRNQATGVLINDCDATSADNPDALVVVRHAVVLRDALIWPAAITAEQKAAAIAQMRDLGILVRVAV
jgi:hypothetical protein